MNLIKSNDLTHPLLGQVIAVDGPTASGKGTLAKRLAKRFRLKFLDTGCIYRATTWLILHEGGSPSDEEVALKAAHKLAEPGVFDFKHKGDNVFGVWVLGHEITEDIRHPEIDAVVAIVAAQPAVRGALLGMQQGFIRQWRNVYGVILDGRDIGWKVAPDAGLKIFMNASADVRAAWRWSEYRNKGKKISLEEVKADLVLRDIRDEGAIAPNLIQRPPARVIDASQLNQDEVEQAACKLIAEVFGVDAKGVS